MIELPEATVLARQINQTLMGKRIVQVVANATPHKFAWFTGDPATYPQRLNESVIVEAAAYGGQVEIQAGGCQLVITTPIRYHAPGDRLPLKHQLLLTFADGAALSCTVQMWGGLMCVKMGDPVEMPDYQVARQKPSPLWGVFDRTYFDSLCDSETPALSAKEFLATKQRIPGLGNGVLQDLLWAARIMPRRRMGDLTPAEHNQLYSALKNVPRAMTECGGRDTERDLFGNYGGYRTVLSKRTLGKPCPNCGTPIRREAYLGGNVYFCTNCQR